MVKAAKKRKKDDEEEEFEFPEFDEAKYLRHEIDLAKATLVTIGLAIPVAVLLYALTLAGITIVAFFAGLAITFALPRVFPVLPWPKIDLTKFERKDWIGQGGTFLFSWLAFWILLVNVPFADITPPVIDHVVVWNGGNGDVGMVNDAQRQQDPVPLNDSRPMQVNATVFENSNVVHVEFTVDGADVPASRVPGQPLYFVSFRGWIAGSTHPVKITATDGSGNAVAYEFRVRIIA